MSMTMLDGPQVLKTVYDSETDALRVSVVGIEVEASNVIYDNATSGLTAENAQDAIDELAAEIDAAPQILAYASSAGAGGGASAVLTVTGLLATDTVLSVSQKVAGANSLPLLGWTTVANDALTVQWSADPGAGAIVVISVKR